MSSMLFVHLKESLYGETHKHTHTHTTHTHYMPSTWAVPCITRRQPYRPSRPTRQPASGAGASRAVRSRLRLYPPSSAARRAHRVSEAGVVRRSRGPHAGPNSRCRETVARRLSSIARAPFAVAAAARLGCDAHTCMCKEVCRREGGAEVTRVSVGRHKGEGRGELRGKWTYIHETRAVQCGTRAAQEQHTHTPALTQLRPHLL